MNCPICLEEIDIDGKKLDCDCNYVYHGNCIDEWLNKQNTCPQCRKNFSVVFPHNQLQLVIVHDPEIGRRRGNQCCGLIGTLLMMILLYMILRNISWFQ